MPQMLSLLPPAASSHTVAEQVRHALQRSGYRDLSALDVHECDGELRIAGQVRTYYLKQPVQLIAQSVDGTLRLDNAVEVG